MEEIRVSTTERAYDVRVGPGALGRIGDYLEGADRVAVIADERVAGIHGDRLEQALAGAGRGDTPWFLVPAGEACKTVEWFGNAQQFLLEAGCTRKSTVIAFGGGACGDLAGFASAAYMRGIDFIQCPTTILAHDSSVGGKTGINLPGGKNMTGAFHQPSAVLYDTDLLETLPPEEIRSGMAEAVKHQLISPDGHARDMLVTVDYSEMDEQTLLHYIVSGIRVKAEIVGRDEREGSVRKFLNFGHTYGHAVEAAAGYGGMTHGESVMIGMLYALILSEQLTGADRGLTDALQRFSERNGYPLRSVAGYPFEQLYGYMQKDKKASYGELHFVLLPEDGHPLMNKADREQCRKADEELRKRLGVLT
ncbi:3-dehydroquinate synthase [Edaphobacillus lindanitolerans]|uniref:3-dehydroquinate synthase n=1 Tax=Edaphobacillus lindanitolerans TaxID=550447 RepID=A0A1U7PKK0_9BACI|nr:3-dehydroquinate synthase [Edaphobacillus lindanitolerans]SIT66446.1 3-dehydroquinate synthase [Edaphobacillus lindanitolerans]